MFHIARIAAIACTLTCLTMAYSAQAEDIASGTYKLDPRHASLQFVVNHFGFSNFVARFNTFEAELSLDSTDIAKSSLTATVDPASVDANMAGFEDHLRGPDFFDVENYPEARFVSQKVEPTGDQTARVTGELTLHGVTRPLTLDMELIGSGTHPLNQSQVVGFVAKGSLNRSDFGINYGLPGVADNVDLIINAEFHLQPE